MIKALCIEGRRTGYEPGQCKNTMTVGELIDFLSGYPEDLKVYLCNDNGYTYGEINYSSFTEYTDTLEFIDYIDKYSIYYDYQNNIYVAIGYEDESVKEFETMEEVRNFCNK